MRSGLHVSTLQSSMPKTFTAVRAATLPGYLLLRTKRSLQNLLSMGSVKRVMVVLGSRCQMLCADRGASEEGYQNELGCTVQLELIKECSNKLIVPRCT